MQTVVHTRIGHDSILSHNPLNDTEGIYWSFELCINIVASSNVLQVSLSIMKQTKSQNITGRLRSASAESLSYIHRTLIKLYRNTGCHYKNLPMLYTAIFTAVTNNKFQLNFFLFFLFLPLNIDCGYTFESPQ